MANSADPDQTAPSGSGSALFVYAVFSETLVYEIIGQNIYHILFLYFYLFGNNFLSIYIVFVPMFSCCVI